MEYEKRMMGSKLQQEEELMERSIRPKTFADYVGQSGVTDNLKIYIEARKC